MAVHAAMQPTHVLRALVPIIHNTPQKMVLDILDLYRRVYEELLAVPVIKGRKTEVRSFSYLSCIYVCICTHKVSRLSFVRWLISCFFKYMYVCACLHTEVFLRLYKHAICAITCT